MSYMPVSILKKKNGSDRDFQNSTHVNGKVFGRTGMAGRAWKGSKEIRLHPWSLRMIIGIYGQIIARCQPLGHLDF